MADSRDEELMQLMQQQNQPIPQSAFAFPAPAGKQFPPLPQAQGQDQGYRPRSGGWRNPQNVGALLSAIPQDMMARALAQAAGPTPFAQGLLGQSATPAQPGGTKDDNAAPPPLPGSPGFVGAMPEPPPVPRPGSPDFRGPMPQNPMSAEVMMLAGGAPIGMGESRSSRSFTQAGQQLGLGPQGPFAPSQQPGFQLLQQGMGFGHWNDPMSPNYRQIPSLPDFLSQNDPGAYLNIVGPPTRATAGGGAPLPESVANAAPYMGSPLTTTPQHQLDALQQQYFRLLGAYLQSPESPTQAAERMGGLGLRGAAQLGLPGLPGSMQNAQTALGLEQQRLDYQRTRGPLDSILLAMANSPNGITNEALQGLSEQIPNFRNYLQQIGVAAGPAGVNAAHARIQNLADPNWVGNRQAPPMGAGAGTTFGPAPTGGQAPPLTGLPEPGSIMSRLETQFRRAMPAGVQGRPANIQDLPLERRNDAITSFVTSLPDEMLNNPDQFRQVYRYLIDKFQGINMDNWFTHRFSTMGRQTPHEAAINRLQNAINNIAPGTVGSSWNNPQTGANPRFIPFLRLFNREE
jgi:hypothetical protein